MTLESSDVLLRLVASAALFFVAVFLSWALYELAKLLHQTNEAVDDARRKVERIEMAIHGIKDRIENSARYLGIIAEGGKSLMSFFQTREEKKERSRKKKGSAEEEEEGE